MLKKVHTHGRSDARQPEPVTQVGPTTMTLPQHRKNNDAGRCQLRKVAERRRMHRRVRPTVPVYDVTRQLT